MNKFIFNNKNSYDDMECIIVGTVSYPLIREDIEIIEVEGRRQGSLVKKTNNYKDLNVKMVLKLVKMNNYNGSNIRIQEWLEDIKDNNLYFLNNPTKSYKVKTVEYTDITPSKGYEAVYDVNFICEPFLKLTREPVVVVNKNDTVFNKGFISSEPIIYLELPSTKQNIQININNSVFQINQAYGNITINSGMFSVIGEEPFKTIGNFPILEKGKNIITWEGNINKFKLEKNTLWRG